MRKKVETNGDTIRNMENEELAELLAVIGTPPGRSGSTSKQLDWLDWLYDESTLRWRGRKVTHAPTWHYQFIRTCSIAASALSILSMVLSLSK